MNDLLELDELLDQQVNLIIKKNSHSNWSSDDLARIDTYVHIQEIIKFKLNNHMDELEEYFGLKK